MSLSQYRRLLDQISRQVAEIARIVGRYLQGTKRTDADFKEGARILYPVIVAGRKQAYEAALKFIASQAVEQEYTDLLPVPDPRDYKIEATTKFLKEVSDRTTGDLETKVAKAAVRHTEDAARKAVEDTVKMADEPAPKRFNDISRTPNNPDSVVKTTSAPPPIKTVGIASRYTTTMAVETTPSVETPPTLAEFMVEEEVEVDDTEDSEYEEREPIAWARQLTGAENCAFCVTLATRGAVYSSRESAMGYVARKNEKGVMDGINRYHDGCDCVAVPVFNVKKWEGNKVSRRLYATVYEKALETYPEDTPMGAVRKYMTHDMKSDTLRVPQMRRD